MSPRFPHPLAWVRTVLPFYWDEIHLTQNFLPCFLRLSSIPLRVNSASCPGFPGSQGRAALQVAPARNAWPRAIPVSAGAWLGKLCPRDNCASGRQGVPGRGDVARPRSQAGRPGRPWDPVAAGAGPLASTWPRRQSARALPPPPPSPSLPSGEGAPDVRGVPVRG